MTAVALSELLVLVLSSPGTDSTILVVQYYTCTGGSPGTGAVCPGSPGYPPAGRPAPRWGRSQ